MPHRSRPQNKKSDSDYDRVGSYDDEQRRMSGTGMGRRAYQRRLQDEYDRPKRPSRYSHPYRELRWSEGDYQRDPVEYDDIEDRNFGREDDLEG